MSVCFFLISGTVAIAVMTVLWLRQRATGNATSVDVAWALGVGLHTAALAWQADGEPVRRAVIASMAGLWSLRLASHLFFDRVLSTREDGRYARLRQKWCQGIFYGFYLAQGALICLLPLTFLGAFQNTRPFPTVLDVLALIIWFSALGGESLADRQLAKFRANPANKGKTCRNGLWRYSRHPNYFFEWLLWCSYIPLSMGSSLFWLSLLGPVLLLVLLLKVSGIPPTEEQAIASRGDDYRAYQRGTSAFVPCFPKKKAFP